MPKKREKSKLKAKIKKDTCSILPDYYFFLKKENPKLSKMKMTKLAKMSLLALAAVILAVPAAASYYRSPCNRRTCNQNHNKVKASTMLQESLLDNFHDFFYSYAGFPTSSSLAYDQIDRKSPLSSYSYAVKQDDESMVSSSGFLSLIVEVVSRDAFRMTRARADNTRPAAPPLSPA